MPTLNLKNLAGRIITLHLAENATINEVVNEYDRVEGIERTLLNDTALLVIDDEKKQHILRRGDMRLFSDVLKTMGHSEQAHGIDMRHIRVALLDVRMIDVHGNARVVTVNPHSSLREVFVAVAEALGCDEPQEGQVGLSLSLSIDQYGPPGEVDRMRDGGFLGRGFFENRQFLDRFELPYTLLPAHEHDAEEDSLFERLQQMAAERDVDVTSLNITTGRFVQRLPQGIHAEPLPRGRRP